jgi:hypothetical protein
MRISMLIAAVLLAIGMCLCAWMIYDEMAYKAEHHCINVGEPQTYIAPIYEPRGQVLSIYYANYTTFLYECDNGKQRF